jgi:hypothetical protein
MKKFLLSLTLVASLGFTANAQIGRAVRKLTIGAEFGLPTQNMSDEIIVGGSLQFEQPIAKLLNLTLSAGYLVDLRTYKLVGGDMRMPGFSTKFRLVPLKAGAKFYFGKYLYGAGEFGAVITNEYRGGTFFTYAPTFGASLALAEKSALDFGLRFESRSRKGFSTGFFGIRAAFAFGL